MYVCLYVCLYVGTAMGNLLCAPIGGFFYDAYDSYVPAIAFAACCWSFGALLCLFTDASRSTVNDDAIEDVDEKEDPVDVNNPDKDQNQNQDPDKDQNKGHVHMIVQVSAEDHVDVVVVDEVEAARCDI